MDLSFIQLAAKRAFGVSFTVIFQPFYCATLYLGLLNTLGFFEKGSADNIYYIASRFLLPASLFLLTISIDFGKIIGLGWRALAMFFAGTIGIIIGGPLAVLLISFVAPEWVGITDGEVPKGEEIWAGLATVAGSWIGGGANQASMQVLYEVKDTLFGTMAVMDVLVAEIWMVVLLFLIKKSDSVDAWLKADNSSIEELKVTVEKYTRENERIAKFEDYKMILGLAFAVVGVAHMAGYFWPDLILGSVDKDGKAYKIFENIGFGSSFFWIIIVSTAFALLLSQTKLRHIEHAGSSKIGTVFIYILVASIGMKMDLTKILDHYQVFFVGLIWMIIHVVILFVVAKLIRAPYFFVAVGSKANVGGAASAPVVAAAFHPSLAPVGVLLAILGYAIGSVGAIATAIMMRAVVGG